MKDFRELIVWQKAHLLVLEIYVLTRDFPREEVYGITSQLKRATVSIPTNIAEGCGRGSDADFNRFLQIAFASASEVEYLLLLCHDLAFLQKEEYLMVNEQVVEVKKILASFIKRLRR